MRLRTMGRTSSPSATAHGADDVDGWLVDQKRISLESATKSTQWRQKKESEEAPQGSMIKPHDLCCDNCVLWTRELN